MCARTIAYVRFTPVFKGGDQGRYKHASCEPTLSLGQLSLPSLWGRQMSTSFGKGRYGSREWQVKLCDPSTTHAIPECFPDEVYVMKRC